nr:glycosyltransferase [uncultured Emticicia sp.]
MTETIAAVVVTFNRLTLLKECIEGLRNQTHKLDSIIVINNGSTDGTDKWLNDQFDLQVIHQENLGGAGGFARGMKEAYNAGFEWIWVMDDDVEPVYEALEKITNFFKISQCINLTKKKTNGDFTFYNVFFNYFTGFINLNSIENLDRIQKKQFHYSNICCFEGMCVNRNLLSLTGLPNSDFFINGDDTTYGVIANEFTNNIFISEPLLIKDFNKRDSFGPKIGCTNENDAYYFFRNQFLIKDELKNKIGRDISNFKKEYLFRVIKAIFICGIYGKWRYIYSIFRGINDGFRRKFGKKTF